MARFYQLKSIHHCWMHCLKDHQFQMKIVGLDMMEISYLVVIELSGQESEEDPDSKNGKDAEEDEDDEGEGILTGDGSSSESQGNIEIPHVRSWTKKLSKTSAGGRQTMPIPARFVNTIVSPEQTDMNIHVQGGSKYHCTVKNNCRRDSELYLDKGWYKFVKDTKLHAGDSLHFWFGNDPNVLNVRIIRKRKRSEIGSS